jgi:hypothetical protein
MLGAEDAGDSMPRHFDIRRGKIGQKDLCTRNFIGGFYGASAILLTARKTPV